MQGVPLVRLRMSVRTPYRSKATKALDELDALYVNGPAAGGGVRKSITSMVETEAEFVSRDLVNVKTQVAV